MLFGISLSYTIRSVACFGRCIGPCKCNALCKELGTWVIYSAVGCGVCMEDLSVTGEKLWASFLRF